MKKFYGFVLILALTAMIWGGTMINASGAAGLPKPDTSYKPAAVQKSAQINTLTKLIQDYDNAWIAYANRGDKKVFSYIASGSTLYKQAQGFRANGYTETLLRVYIKGIDFKQNSAYIKVYECLRKDKSNGQMSFAEYFWVYEARYVNNKWLLYSCVKSGGIMSKLDEAVVINGTEFIADKRVYYSNPKDSGRLYSSNTAGNDILRLTEASGAIGDVCWGSLYFINKSDKNQLYTLDLYDNSVKKAPVSFKEKGWNYFSNNTTIYRFKDDGTCFSKVYCSEVGLDGISKVSGGWVYFTVYSEEGINKYRVTADGKKLELLSHTAVSD